MSDLTFSASIMIGAGPEHVYDLVSDVTRTGEWSPICQWGRWEDGDGPRLGAWFVGHNEARGRTWETRSQVVAADRGEQFAWLVGQGYVYWSYTMRPAVGGTELTESWEFRPEGIAMFRERYGEDAQKQIDERTAAARDGIPKTLAAIKRIAESG